MKWGIRRYQNEDGSLTPAGKARYDELDKQASKYDALSAKSLAEAKKAKTVLEDLNKNRKRSKYYKEYQNPDEEESLDVAKTSAQIDKENAESDVKAYREIADNIRNTKYGSKSIEEIANRKDTISKGVSRAVAVGGVALTALAYNKGAISKGAAATSLVLTGVAAGTTRLKTYGSVYDELKKRKNNTISSKNTTSWNDKKKVHQ